MQKQKQVLILFFCDSMAKNIKFGNHNNIAIRRTAICGVCNLLLTGVGGSGKQVTAS